MRDLPARALDRQHVRRRVGLSDRQGIGPHQRGEQPAHAEQGHQVFGQGFRLVGADPDRDASGPQPLDRVERARIKPRMAVEPGCVMVEEKRKLFGHRRLFADLPQTFESKSQHRPPAKEGCGGIGLGVQRAALSQRLETGIGRVDQVAAGIGQGAVQIEDHRPHPCLVLPFAAL